MKVFNQHFVAHLIDEAGEKKPGLHEHEVGGRVEVGQAENMMLH